MYMTRGALRTHLNFAFVEISPLNLIQKGGGAVTLYVPISSAIGALRGLT